MKLKPFISTMIVVLIAMKSYSQNDSLRSQNDSLLNEIMSYEQSSHEILDKGRRLLREITSTFQTITIIGHPVPTKRAK